MNLQREGGEVADVDEPAELDLQVLFCELDEVIQRWLDEGIARDEELFQYEQEWAPGVGIAGLLGEADEVGDREPLEDRAPEQGDLGVERGAAEREVVERKERFRVILRGARGTLGIFENREAALEIGDTSCVFVRMHVRFSYSLPREPWGILRKTRRWIDVHPHARLPPADG